MAKQQKQRKIPMRKCVVSGEMWPKKDLVRIVRNKEGEVFLDPSGRQNGRGAYIALEPELALKAKAEHTFDKTFNMKIDGSFYDELFAYVDHQKARKELFKDQG